MRGTRRALARRMRSLSKLLVVLGLVSLAACGAGMAPTVTPDYHTPLQQTNQHSAPITSNTSNTH